MIRRQIALELGAVVPIIRLRDNIQLNPNQYVIKIKGIQVSEGEILFDHYMAMNPGYVEEEITGIPTFEPSFHLPAIWITESQRERAESLGYTVVDPPSIIATHLTEVIRQHIAELLTRQDVQNLINNIKDNNTTLIDELVPKLMGVGEIQKVLQNLLEEGISIRDLVTIFETLADHAAVTRDPDILTEYVRQALKRAISSKYFPVGEMTNVVTVDPSIEQEIMNSVKNTEQGSYLSLDPERSKKIIESLGNELKKLEDMGKNPIVITSPIVRMYFRNLAKDYYKDIIVISYNEVESNVELQSVGMVTAKMIVKKFQADTETEAILKAKEELGSGAVVLNVKTLKQRGIFRLFKKDAVEVTAALEEKEFINGINNKKPTFNNKNAADNASGNMKNITDSKSVINLVADEKIDVNGNAANIEKKLDSLHSLLENQITSATANKKNEVHHQDTKGSDTAADSGKQIVKERENANYKFLQLICKKMVDNEVDSKYADEIIADIESSLKKESNIDSILAAVYQKIILKLGEPKTISLGEKPKVIFFIGPTGVGKTTTIAKIASRFKLEKETKVAFITSDTYRIAAVEQLNTYASIIDCPVNVAYSPDEMDECLNEFKNYELILVDTAGRSHKSDEQMEELEKLISKVEARADEFDFEIYLTLSVTTKYKDLKNIADKYKHIDNWSLIFTKLDETCCLGNMLNMKLYTDAPLSYTTSGQNVPNDIEVINEQGLAKLLLGGNS